MTEEILDTLAPLSPVDFFTLSCDVHYSKAMPTGKLFSRSFLLPDTSGLLAEESFATLKLAWNEEALFLSAAVQKPFEESCYPHFAEGDGLELFFDTRDLKTAGFITRFCHHFLVLPKEVQGIKAQEITRFRTEDTHPLCDPLEIGLDIQFSSSSYQMQIVIPASCLHGYDPKSFDRLGFTYRFNRYKKEAQHFSVSSKFYAIEQHPSLWSSLKLVK